MDGKWEVASEMVSQRGSWKNRSEADVFSSVVPPLAGRSSQKKKKRVACLQQPAKPQAGEHGKAHAQRIIAAIQRATHAIDTRSHTHHTLSRPHALTHSHTLLRIPSRAVVSSFGFACFTTLQSPRIPPYFLTLLSIHPRSLTHSLTHPLTHTYTHTAGPFPVSRRSFHTTSFIPLLLHTSAAHCTAH